MRVAKDAAFAPFCLVLHNLLLSIFVLPITVFGIILVFVLIPLGLPCSLWFYSPNFGLRKKDMAIVFVYLDAFQHLHLDLVRDINAVRQQKADTLLLAKINF